MSTVPSRRSSPIDTDQLIRWSGLTLILAGLLFGLFPFAHPNHDPDGFRGAIWVPAHLMPNVGAIVALFGLIGVFVRQLRAAGWLGVIAFVATIVGTASFVSGLMIEAFIIPYMSLAFPEVILDDTPPPGIGEAFVVIRMLFMLGFILVGAAVIRAGLLPRGVGMLLIVATLVNTFGDILIGEPAFYFGSVTFGIALGWLGAALWNDRGGRPGASRLRAQPSGSSEPASDSDSPANSVSASGSATGSDSVSASS